MNAAQEMSATNCAVTLATAPTIAINHANTNSTFVAVGAWHAQNPILFTDRRTFSKSTANTRQSPPVRKTHIVDNPNAIKEQIATDLAALGMGIMRFCDNEA